jgi:cytoskeletal protein CcmA (bactofilin family)
MGIWRKRKDEDALPQALAAPLVAGAPETRTERPRTVAVEPVAELARRPSSARIALASIERTATGERSARTAAIGKSITIKGDIVGAEDLLIEGRVEGRVELRDHQLTIGAAGEVIGEVRAKQVTVLGRITGNVAASERVEVADGGILHGDIESARLLLQEGSQINGKVDMRPPQSAPVSPPRKTEKADGERLKGNSGAASSTHMSVNNGVAAAAVPAF